MNKFEIAFQKKLSANGWTLSTRGELAMWVHSSRPGRRFDTACAMAETLKGVMPIGEATQEAR